MATRVCVSWAAPAFRHLVAALLLVALGASPAAGGEDEDVFSVRVHGGIGLYLMSDVRELSDAWLGEAPYAASHDDDETLGIGGEWSFYVDFMEYRGWTVGLGSGYLCDKAIVVWRVPSWDPWWGDTYLQTFAEVRTTCRTVELCATRRLPEDWEVPVSAFFRVSAGLAWAKMHGKGESMSVDDDALAPIIQVALGADLCHVWFLDPTLEVGVRFLNPGFNCGGKVASSEMDEYLRDFADGGSANFSGFYVSIGLVFFD